MAEEMHETFKNRKRTTAALLISSIESQFSRINGQDRGKFYYNLINQNKNSLCRVLP